MKTLFPSSPTQVESSQRTLMLGLLTGGIVVAVVATALVGSYTSRAGQALTAAVKPGHSAPVIVALAPQVRPAPAVAAQAPRVYRLETVVITATPEQVAAARAEFASQKLAQAAGQVSAAAVGAVAR
jgi:hypothetical protein